MGGPPGAGKLYNSIPRWMVTWLCTCRHTLSLHGNHTSMVKSACAQENARPRESRLQGGLDGDGPGDVGDAGAPENPRGLGGLGVPGSVGWAHRGLRTTGFQALELVTVSLVNP